MKRLVYLVDHILLGGTKKRKKHFSMFCPSLCAKFKDSFSLIEEDMFAQVYKVSHIFFVKCKHNHKHQKY